MGLAVPNEVDELLLGLLLGRTSLLCTNAPDTQRLRIYETGKCGDFLRSASKLHGRVTVTNEVILSGRRGARLVRRLGSCEHPGLR